MAFLVRKFNKNSNELEDEEVVYERPRRAKKRSIDDVVDSMLSDMMDYEELMRKNLKKKKKEIKEIYASKYKYDSESKKEHLEKIKSLQTQLEENQKGNEKMKCLLEEKVENTLRTKKIEPTSTSTPTESSKYDECIVCCDRFPDTVVPCGHRFCEGCCRSLVHLKMPCSFCRKKIDHFIKIINPW